MDLFPYLPRRIFRLSVPPLLRLHGDDQRNIPRPSSSRLASCIDLGDDCNWCHYGNMLLKFFYNDILRDVEIKKNNNNLDIRTHHPRAF